MRVGVMISPDADAGEYFRSTTHLPCICRRRNQRRTVGSVDARSQSLPLDRLMHVMEEAVVRVPAFGTFPRGQQDRKSELAEEV